MPTCPSCLVRYAEGTATCDQDGDRLVPDETFANVEKELAAGDQVGEFQIQGKLGEGGFGTVYRAEHPLIGKPAAVKVLSRQFSSSAEMVSRFIAEARAVNQIRHKNIIDIFSFGQLADGRQYYVMELLDGTPFDRFLAERGPLSLAEALPLLRGVARAVDAAHAKGILHRDLKPENVYLVFDDVGGVSPKLLDFGLAKLVADPTRSHKTKSGTPMGTPYYMSPEQCRGQDVDGRTDVYAFGAMVFEVLTGKVPFDGTSPMDVLVKHMTSEPPSAEALVAQLPRGVDAVLHRMLAKEPADRPTTLASAMDSFAALVPGSSPSTVVRVSREPSPEQEKELGSGATMLLAADSVPDLTRPKSAQTFLGAEADIAPAPAKRGVAAVALVALALGALVGIGVVVVGRTRPEANGTALAQGIHDGAAVSSAPLGSAVVVPAVVVTTSPSSPTPLAGSAQAAVDVAAAQGSRDVDVRVEATPGNATVSVDGKDLGAAPGPFKLKSGDPVTLTFSAKGYKSRDLTVTPVGDDLVKVVLDKQPPRRDGAAKGPAIPSDLEGFDKK